MKPTSLILLILLLLQSGCAQIMWSVCGGELCSDVSPLPPSRVRESGELKTRIDWNSLNESSEARLSIKIEDIYQKTPVKGAKVEITIEPANSFRKILPWNKKVEILAEESGEGLYSARHTFKDSGRYEMTYRISTSNGNFYSFEEERDINPR